MSGAHRRSVAGAMLAVFFVLSTQAIPAQALSPDWKDELAEIDEIRSEAIADLVAVAGDFEEYLAGGPSAAQAAKELATTLADMGEVKSEAVVEIRSIMDEYPRAPQVQHAGWFAIGLVTATESFYADLTTLRYEEYIAGLPPPQDPPPTTTTTTLPVTTTTLPVTTTTLPVTTTTRPVTTTTLPVTTTTLPVTTTTLPVTTTTSPSAGPSTTTTTTSTTAAPGSTTTTTTVAATTANSGASSDPPAPAAIDQGSAQDFLLSADAEGDRGGLPQAGESANLLDIELSGKTESNPLPFQRGITASLTRVLEPLLPTRVAEVVVSPLLIIELLWRAISSSGQGLVMPISLLSFSIFSLLWDRRRSRKVPEAFS